MTKIFKTFEFGIQEIDEITEGCWISLTDPSATELLEVSEKCEIDIGSLRAPLDEEERSRIETEDKYTLILVDIPSIEKRNEKDRYVTIPLGIIIAENVLITTCLEETSILQSFVDGRVRGFYTNKKQGLFYKSCIEMHQFICNTFGLLIEKVKKLKKNSISQLKIKN